MRYKFLGTLFVLLMAFISITLRSEPQNIASAQDAINANFSPVVLTGVILPEGVRYHLSFVKPEGVILRDFLASVTLPAGAEVQGVLLSSTHPFVGAQGDGNLTWTSTSASSDEEVLSFGFSLSDPDLVTPTPSNLFPVCSLTLNQNASVFTGPSARFNSIKVLTAGTKNAGLARALDTQNFYWWRLQDGSWIREDTTDEEGECDRLPVFDLQTGLSTSLTNLPPNAPNTALLTSDFSVSFTWSGDQAGSVSYTGKAVITEARGTQGDIALNNHGSSVELQPVSNTGVQVGIEFGEVPNNTVIGVKELEPEQNPPAELGEFWWCSELEITNLPADALVTVRVPLRGILLPGTPVSLFALQEDGTWKQLDSIGVVSFDGQTATYLHPGGVVATGIGGGGGGFQGGFQTGGFQGGFNTGGFQGGFVEQGGFQGGFVEQGGFQGGFQTGGVQGGFQGGENFGAFSAEVPGTAGSEGGGAAPSDPANQGSPADAGQNNAVVESGSTGGGAGQGGQPPAVVEEPPVPDTSCPSTTLGAQDALQILAQTAIDRGLKADPVLTLEPAPAAAEDSLTVTLNGAATALPIHEECGTIDNRKVCTVWVSVGDCVVGVEQLRTCVEKGNIVCSPNASQ